MQSVFRFIHCLGICFITISAFTQANCENPFDLGQIPTNVITCFELDNSSSNDTLGCGDNIYWVQFTTETNATSISIEAESINNFDRPTLELHLDECENMFAGCVPELNEIYYPNNSNSLLGISSEVAGEFNLCITPTKPSSSTHALTAQLLEVYPNPANRLINIHVAKNINYQAAIYDLEGRQLMNKSNCRSMNTAALNNGTYLLEITDKNTGIKIFERIQVFK